MNDTKILTPTITDSLLSDGTVVYTASVEELPGVVAEGPSPPAALSELIALLENIRQRLGWDTLGFKTETVPFWRWDGYSGGKRTSRHGTTYEQLDLKTELPEGFMEAAR